MTNQLEYLARANEHRPTDPAQLAAEVAKILVRHQLTQQQGLRQ